MVSSVFCLSNSPFALYFSLLWNFSGRFTEGTVLAYKNRTTGGLYRVEVPTPTFLEGEFAACNFRVATKSSSHALWVAQYIQRTKRSVRPQLFKWWIPLSTVDNAELVFIISIAIIRWIGLSLRLNNRSPVMRQGVSYKRLKTMKMLKLSPQCREWSQSTSYERPGGQGWYLG